MAHFGKKKIVAITNGMNHLAFILFRMKAAVNWCIYFLIHLLTKRLYIFSLTELLVTGLETSHTIYIQKHYNKHIMYRAE